MFVSKRRLALKRFDSAECLIRVHIRTSVVELRGPLRHALFDRLGSGFIVRRFMPLPIVCGSAVNVCRILFLVVLKGRIFAFFNLCLSACFGCFSLDLVDDIKCAALVPLQVSASQHKRASLLFMWLEKR